mgnify:CR=1 FL=1
MVQRIGVSIRQMLSWNKAEKCLRCGGNKEGQEMFCIRCIEKIEQEEKERQERKREEYLMYEKEVLKNIGVPERYLDSAWEKSIIKGKERIMEMTKDGGCFYFVGIPGAGKTYAAVCVLREWLRQETEGHEEKARLVILPEFFGNMRRYGKSQAWVNTEIARKKILVLDELGVSEQDYALEVLYNIINYRYNRPTRGFRTIITSNLTLDEVKDRMHDRMSSRINEMATIVNFKAEDLRVKIKQEKYNGFRKRKEDIK